MYSSLHAGTYQLKLGLLQLQRFIAEKQLLL
jgi:hypothetical protein